MIKTRLLIFLNCLLLTHSVYSSTEVKPPSGPFVSMLRATFSDSKSIMTPSTSILKATIETEEKEYNFEVPDLGRYSERPNNVSSDTYHDMNTSKAFETIPLIDSDKNKQVIYENVFDSLAIEKKNQKNPFTSSVNATSQATSPTPNQSFDNLPIARPQNGENGFYPPEWAQPNPLRPLNRAPQNNSNTNFFNPNSMRGMPFANQMPPWNSGNQTNNGYR